MAGKLKSPLLVLIVLIVVSVALAGGVFVLLQKEKAKNLAIQEALDDIKTRLKVTENRLNESNKTITDLNTKLQQAEAQIATLNTELQQEKVSKEEALSQIEQLRVDLEQQKGLRVDLEKKVDQAQKNADKMQAQLKDLESKKNELESKVKDLEDKTQAGQGQGVELGKIVVGPEGSAQQPAAAPPAKAAKAKAKKEKPQKQVSVPPAPTAAPEVEGKVLIINKDYNFVVINLGSKDGINVGDNFALYHASKYIGDIKVEKVHESMAAAGFVAVDTKDKVSEGDKVVRKANK